MLPPSQNLHNLHHFHSPVEPPAISSIWVAAAAAIDAAAPTTVAGHDVRRSADNPESSALRDATQQQQIFAPPTASSLLSMFRDDILQLAEEAKDLRRSAKVETKDATKSNPPPSSSSSSKLAALNCSISVGFDAREDSKTDLDYNGSSDKQTDDQDEKKKKKKRRRRKLTRRKTRKRKIMAAFQSCLRTTMTSFSGRARKS